MDLVVPVPHHPHPGETVLGSDYLTFSGGKGANQAVAAARAGVCGAQASLPTQQEITDFLKAQEKCDQSQSPLV